VTISADQQLVNESWAHISKTKTRSVNENGICIYGGCGCALQPTLINPDETQKRVGSSAIVQIIANYPEHLHPWARTVDRFFARDVQFCHDYEVPDNLIFLDVFARRLAALIRTKHDVTEPPTLTAHLAQAGRI